MIISNEINERQKWLNSLQVGDEVAVSTRGWGARSYVISTVTKVTPSRMIDVGNTRFNNDGTKRGDYYGSRLEPVTEELRQRLLVEAAVSKIKRTTWEALTPQQILDVLKIIQG